MAKVDPKEVVARLRKSFRGGKTRSLRFRREQLRATIAMVKERESAFLDALRADLRKPQTEGWVSDLGLVASEAEFALDHLEEWAAPEKVKVPLVVHPARAQILREPYGVTLNISPWNYPIELALGPMISAVAAGNCMVMKPSEITPHCSAALAEWVPQYLDDDCIAVVEGAVPETTALLEERFDYIFYTGNENVGRIVMTAAAKNLTPVTLELGGKSPCFVDHHVDLGVAARRIAWGKFFNAGQTCVAPDYLLVDKRIEKALLDEMKSVLQTFYGDDPQKSPDFGRIVSERHFDRVAEMMGSGECVVGGNTDRGDLYIAPTIYRGIEGHEPIMESEIFGPLLAVKAVSGVDEALDFLGERPKPLALYCFSKRSDVRNRFAMETSSGTLAFNDVVAQYALPCLPFGGVGASGMGKAHGRAGFETFSHPKGILQKTTVPDPVLRYPPYSKSREGWLRRLL